MRSDVISRRGIDPCLIITHNNLTLCIYTRQPSNSRDPSPHVGTNTREMECKILCMHMLVNCMQSFGTPRCQLMCFVSSSIVICSHD